MLFLTADIRCPSKLPSEYEQICIGIAQKHGVRAVRVDFTGRELTVKFSEGTGHLDSGLPDDAPYEERFKAAAQRAAADMEQVLAAPPVRVAKRTDSKTAERRKSPAERSAKSRHSWLTNPTVPFCVAVVFMILVVALRSSTLTNPQSFWVIRATLAVAVAAVAVAALNGVISVTFKSKNSAGAWAVRATGGLAVFVLLYIYTPNLETQTSPAAAPPTPSVEPSGPSLATSTSKHSSVGDEASANTGTDRSAGGAPGQVQPPERSASRAKKPLAGTRPPKEAPPKDSPPKDSLPNVIISSVNQSGGITAQNVTVNNVPPTETIDFNGAHRTTRPGFFGVVGGTPEQEAFVEILKLQDAKAWSDIERVSGLAVANYPAWLTGYLFLGVAQANLGKRDLAIVSLTHVTERAQGDPDYADAARILNQLQTRR